MENTLDPHDELLHRVLHEHLVKYKAGRIPTVRAICGKVWSPIFPVDRSIRRSNCPICFPSREHRFDIAA